MLVVKEAAVVAAVRAVQHCCRHNSSLRFPRLILSMGVLVMGRQKEVARDTVDLILGAVIVATQVAGRNCSEVAGRD